MIGSLTNRAGRLIDRIRINAVSEEVRDGRLFLIKRRRWSAAPVLAIANSFFRLADARINALQNTELWQRWEIECFLALHGDRFQALRVDGQTIATEQIPGVNLTLPLDNDALTPQMAAAAGRELRRGHDLVCAEFAGPWSHGDPHLGNFLYDESADRARIIDFEVRHHRGLAAEERQADDVLVFLQDMLGRIAPGRWLPCARAFLDAYDRRHIAARAINELTPPRGVASLWWSVRTSWLGAGEVSRRVETLRAGL